MCFNSSSYLPQSMKMLSAMNIGGDKKTNDHERKKKIILQKQKRLLLLHHAASCPHEEGTCPVTPHCAAVKQLWKHLGECQDDRCQRVGCFSTRALLTHFKRCEDPRCLVCVPLRRRVLSSKNQNQPSGDGRNGRPPLPPGGGASDTASAVPSRVPSLRTRAQPTIPQSQRKQQDSKVPSSISIVRPAGMVPPRVTPPAATAATAAPRLQGAPIRYMTRSQSGATSSNAPLGPSPAPKGQNPNIGSSRLSTKSSRRTNDPTDREKIDNNDTTREQENIRRRQRRLFLLYHATVCKNKSNACPVSRHCGEMKRLLAHMADCKKSDCGVPHCRSSKGILSHYQRCKNRECPVCIPVRNYIRFEERNNVEKKVQQQQVLSARGKRSGSSLAPARRTKRLKVDPTDPNNLEMLPFADHIRFLAKSFPVKLKAKCQEILTGLMNSKYGWVFNEPVNPKALEIPDYFEVIKNPMDLGTIRTKLDLGDYRTIDAFRSDVNLCFDNALLYNGEGSEVYDMAKDLKNKFEVNYKKLMKQQT